MYEAQSDRVLSLPAYAISLARKLDIVVFMLPEDIVEVRAGANEQT